MHGGCGPSPGRGGTQGEVGMDSSRTSPPQPEVGDWRWVWPEQGKGPRGPGPRSLPPAPLFQVPLPEPSARTHWAVKPVLKRNRAVVAQAIFRQLC